MQPIFSSSGPRSGKGVSFVVPNGLTWRGSMVVLDIKMENFAKFGQARFAGGDAVFVFAPGSTKSHRYNPLDFVRPGPEMATDCANIAGFLCGGGIVENEWTMAARKVVGALLGYVLTSADFEGQRYIRSAVRMISTGFDIEKLLRKIVASETGGRVPQWVLDEFNQLIVIPERTRGSVMFNVANAFAPWSSQLISAVTQTSDFNLRDLRRKRMSIFIGAPLADLESYRPLVRILFQQIHDVLMRDLPGKDEPHQVLLLLGEFFALGKMTSLASKIVVSAGYGFRMAIILQNISQLDEIYGRPTRETMVSGTAIKLFVAINDNETAEYVSKSLGSYTATSTTKVAGSGFSQARVSLGEMAVPQRGPQELTRMHRVTSILMVANSRPFEVRKVFYYKSGALKRMMNASKRTQLVVPALDGWADKVLWTNAPTVTSIPGEIVTSTPVAAAASPELIVPETPSSVRSDHQTVLAEIVVAPADAVDGVIVAPEPPLEGASNVANVAAPRLIHARKTTPPTTHSAKAKAANDGFDLTADIAAIEAKMESGAAAAMEETLGIIDQALVSQPEGKAEPIRRARARLKGTAAQARAKRA